MTHTRARSSWPNPAAHEPGWAPPTPPAWVPPPQAGAPLPFPPAPPTEWPGGASTPPGAPGGGVPSGPGWAGPTPPAPPAQPDSSAPWEPSRPPVGLQNLLLGLGTALVAISVVVFTAVNWSQLDASVQGLVLVALTVVAGMAAALAARREMPATAEALGAVAVLMALADVHALRVGLAPAVDGLLFWAGGFAVVAGLAAVAGRARSIRSPQIAAGLLIQLPLLCVLRWADALVWQAQLAVVAQAFVVLAVADRVEVPRWARRVAQGWAIVTALLLTTATVVDSLTGSLFGDVPAELHRGATGGCLAAAAVLSLFVAWRRAESDDIRLIGLFTATASGLAAVWFVAVDPLGSETAVGLLALAAAIVLLGTRSLPRAWGEVPSVTAGLIGGGAVLPLLGAIASMLAAASAVTSAAWARSGSQLAADLQIADARSYGSLGVALQLAALAVGAAALIRRGSSRQVAAASAVTGLAALAVSPLLAPLTINGTVLLALAAMALATLAAVVLGARRSGFSAAVAFVVLAGAWAAPWAMATPVLSFVALGASIVLAVALAAVARRDEAVEVAVGAVVWVVAAAPLLAGLVAWNAGTGPAMSWALASVVAAVLSIAGVVLLDPMGEAPGVSRVMRQAVEASALVAYLATLLGAVCVADPDAASVALAAGAIGFGLHAARPRRALCGLAAATELLVLIWLRLQQADVVVVEAYTVPLAVALLGIGLIGTRLHRRAEGVEPASWVTFGPALVVGLAPTVWLAFSEPGSVRPLIGLVAGAAVLVTGVTSGKRAFVDVGTATVVALGLRQVAPVVGEIPNWATIGATGLALILVGATFEQRRRDLKAVLRRYSALT